MQLVTFLSSLLAIRQTHASRSLTLPDGRVIPLPRITMVNNMANDTTAVITCHDTARDRTAFLSRDSTLHLMEGEPSGTPQHIDPEDISIPLGEVNSTTSIALPGFVHSCRAYFARGELWFGTVGNGGEHIGLVQPAFLNPSDPNFNISAGFVEFTWAENGSFAVNPSAVDFVDVPIALNLTEYHSNKTQSVAGLFTDAKHGICEQLKNASSPEAPWEKGCVYDAEGDLIRVAAPIHIIGGSQGAFDKLYDPYVDEFLRRFSTEPLTVRIPEGHRACWTDPVAGTISCDGMGRTIPFKPTPAEIFGCAGGPFGRAGAQGSESPIMTIICAGLNRGNILDHHSTDHAMKSKAYQSPVHNVYAKAVHDNEHNGAGYAFPYDDVDINGENVAGLLAVSYDNVGELIIHIGGLHASPLRSNTTAPVRGFNAAGHASPVDADYTEYQMLVDPHRSDSTVSTVAVMPIEMPSKIPHPSSPRRNTMTWTKTTAAVPVHGYKATQTALPVNTYGTACQVLMNPHRNNLTISTLSVPSGRPCVGK